MPQQAARVFRVPAVLAVLSTIGLGGALVGEGVLDLLSCLALGMPVLVILLAFARRLPQ